ncbi:hypothetical protein MRY87_00185 [bacterium]|nr:hypothetical protein [bacterium]
MFSSGGVPKVIADIQFVGSVSSISKTWLWSWANSTVVDSVKDQISKVRHLGNSRDFWKLTKAKWQADEIDGWEMTSVAAFVLKAKGAYKSPDDNGAAFMVFTDIDWAGAKGSTN